MLLKHYECWQTFFNQHDGLQAFLRKLRTNRRLELDGSILAKCGSRKDYSGAGRFSTEGVVGGGSIAANVATLKHFLPEQLKPDEVVYASVRDRRRTRRCIKVVFELLEKGDVETVKEVSKPDIQPKHYTTFRDFDQSKTSRLEDVNYFYKIIGKLESQVGGKRILSRCTGRMNWPRRGVYFFFEKGEYRSSGNVMRVVRVGTHALKTGSKTTLWNRLIMHRGPLSGMYAGGGGHRGSIFRVHVGTAIIKKHVLTVHTWGVGSSAGREIRMKEHAVEKLVSEHIRSMPFLWVKVDDEPGPDSLRAYIERNTIELLSNYNRTTKIDPPSPNWLGRFCKNEKVQRSGLWNSDYVDEAYDKRFLDKLEELVYEMS